MEAVIHNMVLWGEIYSVLLGFLKLGQVIHNATVSVDSLSTQTLWHKIAIDILEDFFLFLPHLVLLYCDQT